MIRLQDFKFNKSQYERPTQKKICGWSLYGKPCQLGPDYKGQCQADAECVPIKKEDRWYCTRTSNAGGKCEQGPLPNGQCCKTIPKCVPLENSRLKRGRLSLWVFALALASIILLITSESRLAFINPGELTTNHSFGGEQCEHCHSQQTLNPNLWLAEAFADPGIDQENAKCLNCHQMGDFASQPHGMSQPSIARLSTKMIQASGLPLNQSNDATLETRQFLCAACHREHLGKDRPLTALSIDQCESCHVQKHPDFQADHPEFKRFPYWRRTHLIFDHSNHIEDYFNQTEMQSFAPTACGGCHFPDDTGQYMQTVSFEKSCIGCHLQDVRGEKQQTGLKVLNLPALDIETLNEREIDIGGWPSDLEGEDFMLSPFMIYLLSIDPVLNNRHGDALHQVLQALQAGDYELADLTTVDDYSDDEQSQTAIFEVIEDLVLAIKRIFYSRQDQLLLRLAQYQMTIALDQIDSSRLIKVKQQLQRLTSEDLADEQKREQFETEQRDTIRLSEADIDICGQLEDDYQQEYSMQNAFFQRHLSIYVERVNLNIWDKQTRSVLKYILPPDYILNASRAWLGSLPCDARDESETGSFFQAIAHEQIADEWQQSGGWYLMNYAIYYRPSGHRDEFLRGWMSMTAKLSDRRPIGISQLVETDETVGRCLKCHSIDESVRGVLEDENKPKVLHVNWKAKKLKAGRRNFTRFDHSAHFPLLNEQGCKNCHFLKQESHYLASFIKDEVLDYRSNRYESNFKSIEKALCAECHESNRAGNHCLVCHNYHVGDFAPTLPHNPLNIKAKD